MGSVFKLRKLFYAPEFALPTRTLLLLFSDVKDVCQSLSQSPRDT